jgi:Cyclic nucleotide-binding domain
VFDVAAGTLLTRAGEPGDEFFLIIDGTARADVSPEEHVLLHPDEFFGEMSLLDGGARSATVVANTPVRLRLGGGQNARGPSGAGADTMPRPSARPDANSLKHQPSRVLSALALNKQPRGAGADALRQLRDTILGLLREPNESLCAECVATALGQQVRVVIMSMLGLRDGVASVQGVCSTCHRHARVIRRETPG